MSEILSVHLRITIWQITVMKRLKSLTTETIFSDFGWDKSHDSLVQHKETKEQLYLMQTSKATRRHGCSPTYPSHLPEKSSSRTGGHSWRSWNLPHFPLLLLPLWNTAQSDEQLLLQGTLWCHPCSIHIKQVSVFWVGLTSSSHIWLYHSLLR